MAAVCEAERFPVFLSYSYLEDYDGQSFETPQKIIEFSDLIMKSGFPDKSLITGITRVNSDCGPANWCRWYEKMLKESRIVLCFPSRQYLNAVENGVDEYTPKSGDIVDKHEPYLPGSVIRSVMFSNMSVPFVPVFLGIDRDSSLLPIPLQSRKCYTIKYPFDASTVQDSQDPGLKALWSQVLHMPNERAAPLIPVGRPAVDANHTAHGKYMNIYLDTRSLCFFPKKELILKNLAEHVRAPWDDLAQQLGLAKSDIDAIKYNHPDFREQCYQVLMKWTQAHATVATVAELSRAIKAANQHTLLSVLADALVHIE